MSSRSSLEACEIKKGESHRVFNRVCICELAQQLDGARGDVAVVMGQQRQDVGEAAEPDQLRVQLWGPCNGLEPAYDSTCLPLPAFSRSISLCSVAIDGHGLRWGIFHWSMLDASRCSGDAHIVSTCAMRSKAQMCAQQDNHHTCGPPHQGPARSP